MACCGGFARECGGFAREFAVEDSQGSLTLWRIRKGVCRCGGFAREIDVLEDSVSQAWRIRINSWPYGTDNLHDLVFWRIRSPSPNP